MTPLICNQGVISAISQEALAKSPHASTQYSDTDTIRLVTSFSEMHHSAKSSHESLSWWNWITDYGLDKRFEDSCVTEPSSIWARTMLSLWIECQLQWKSKNQESSNFGKSVPNSAELCWTWQSSQSTTLDSSPWSHSFIGRYVAGSYYRLGGVSSI